MRSKCAPESRLFARWCHDRGPRMSNRPRRLPLPALALAAIACAVLSACVQQPSPRPLPSPALTPTPLGGGSKIAFASDRSGSYQIYVTASDGSAETQLTDLPTDNYFPEFSPDGSQILFWAVDSSVDPPFAELRFILSDGSKQRVFGSGLGWTSWAPDGKGIALVVSWEAGNSIPRLERRACAERKRP